MKNWISDINQITETSLLKFGNLSVEQLNWKSNQESWSIAQNLDHLIVVNETYYPVLDALKHGTYKRPFMSRFGFMVPFLGKTVLKAVQPDRKNKMKTFPIWEPSMDVLILDVVQRFTDHQSELGRQILQAQPLVEKGVVISSPANRNIVYTLETAFDIIVAHEQRHLEQAMEVLRMIPGATK